MNKMRLNLRYSVVASLSLIASVLSYPNFVMAQNYALSEGVAAIVNDDAITSFDVRQRTRFILITSGITKPSQDAIIQASNQALDSLINEKLQIQEAKKFKINMSDAEVDNIIANQAKQNGGTLTEFLQELSNAGISTQSYRDKTRAEVLWQRIVSGRYGSRVKISKDQINEAIERIQASANKPQYQISEIFIEVASPQEEERARAGAQTLVKQIREGASFAKVAQQFSFAPSAATGGDLGWIGQGELKPEVAAEIDNIALGQISDPIKVQGGYMIVGIRNKREGKNPEITLKLSELSIAIPANSDEAKWQKSQNLLKTARASINNCDGLNKIASKNAFKYINLGDVSVNALDEPFKSNAAPLHKNQTSDVFRTAEGVHVLVACDRVVTGEDIPSMAQIEDGMTDQELNLIARRYLRDIRREAAVVTR